MTVSHSRFDVDEIRSPPLWLCALLGIVLIIAGIFALGDIAFATVVSVKLIGLSAIVAGAFEIIHLFMTRGWGGSIWQSTLGTIYIVFGLGLLAQPETGALILTFFLGALLFASGILRFGLGLRHRRKDGSC